MTAIDDTPIDASDIDPFLAGNYAPVHDELDVADLEVTGTIPEALSGAYLRNGANPAYEPMGAYHWFDGDGMIHGVHLDGGRATYRNRWVNTLGLQLEREAGRNLFGGINNFTFPEGDLFEKMGGPFKNAANTSIVRHAGKVLALWEGGHPHELDIDDLSTVGMWNFDGKLVDAMTAHPHMDAATGEMLFFGYDQLNSLVRFYVADAAGVITRMEEISLPAPVMMHDFQITEHHAVFLDAPAVLNLEGALTGEPGIVWRPENGTRIGILPRDGQGTDGLRWFEVDNMYVFHFMNSFEADGKIVIDACRFPRMNMPDSTIDPAEAADMMPRLTRITLDPATGSSSMDVLVDRPCEFPRVAPADEAHAYRYGYAPSSSAGIDFDSVMKYDHQTGAAEYHRYAGNVVCGEAVFAPDPDGSADDDGWLLNFVYDADRNSSDFVIVDARDLTETARVSLPRRVPFGFHGNWMPR